jgi:2-methylcitrate dehydratase PrpD
VTGWNHCSLTPLRRWHDRQLVFSPSLALAEERGISGKRFVTAVVAGFEVACRVAAALQPAATNARGFHPTGTTGALWSTAAAGTLLGLDAEQSAWRESETSPSSPAYSRGLS